MEGGGAEGALSAQWEEKIKSSKRTRLKQQLILMGRLPRYITVVVLFFNVHKNRCSYIRTVT